MKIKKKSTWNYSNLVKILKKLFRNKHKVSYKENIIKIDNEEHNMDAFNEYTLSGDCLNYTCSMEEVSVDSILHNTGSDLDLPSFINDYKTNQSYYDLISELLKMSLKDNKCSFITNQIKDSVNEKIIKKTRMFKKVGEYKSSTSGETVCTYLRLYKP